MSEYKDGKGDVYLPDNDLASEYRRGYVNGTADGRADALRPVLAALTSEDEIAHGEAITMRGGAGVGVCAYCEDEWPCRTQRGIDRLLSSFRVGKLDT